MKHRDAYRDQPTLFIPSDCPGELTLLGRFPDATIGDDRLTLNGSTRLTMRERTVYLHVCRSCGHAVAIARDHCADAELVPLAFELLNSYLPRRAQGANGRPVVTEDVND